MIIFENDRSRQKREELASRALELKGQTVRGNSNGLTRGSVVQKGEEVLVIESKEIPGVRTNFKNAFTVDLSGDEPTLGGSTEVTQDDELTVLGYWDLSVV